MSSPELSLIQRKILNFLLRTKEAKLSELAKELNVTQEGLFSVAETLKNLGLLKIEEIEERFLKLTKEGKLYLEQGLPERRIVNLVGKDREIDINSLYKLGLSKEEIAIGLKWIKEKGWGYIQKGKLIVNKVPEIGEDEKTIQLFNNTESIKENSKVEKVAEILIRRNLITVEVKKDGAVQLTKKGEEEAQKLEKIVSEPQEIKIISSYDVLSGEWKKKKIKKYNLEAKPRKYYGGAFHPYYSFEEKVREILVGMGFEESDGPFIEPEFWVFDVLFQRQNHPARELFDTYRLKNLKTSLKSIENVKIVKELHEKTYGEAWSEDVASRLVLRGQTTCVSVRFLFERKKPPIKMFVISDVFRSDVIDATHHIQFKQIEGIMGEYGVTFRHLLGILDEFYKKVGFTEIRFVPSYFPFTEPSVEIIAKHEKLGWIEMGGAGMFRPEVLKAVSVNFPVAAWGLGFDRLAMVALGIDDIRKLRTINLSELRGE
ncbi:MAG: phenylalanine--tRNA ligase subunit alpha [Candidatus Brockarchaeota archaeon]|nr:phenylalanine--tRNA ligase subunit alpha [Candidatus Brockarchaeota archaeon]MBO3768443.1 phenylalanine--tRNA ligase subunit alpha [Candidatus Brockarchaeota archaeon]MBO3801543.1 phenylalanine--tRNA ligase subunit alpha [Candidatus Brockarchaeota archaeon]